MLHCKATAKNLATMTIITIVSSVLTGCSITYSFVPDQSSKYYAEKNVKIHVQKIN